MPKLFILFFQRQKAEVNIRIDDEKFIIFYKKKKTKMTKNTAVKMAIFNIGGATIASRYLNVSTSTIANWIRNGVIPNIEKAKLVAGESGFDLTLLRPRFEQRM